MSGGGGGKGKGHHEEEHEEHVNHEAWVIPYADVLTLLMALFLVLFALGQVDEENLEVAAESFRDELNGPGFLDFGGGGAGEGPSAFAAGALGILEGLGPLPSSGDDPMTDDEEQEEGGTGSGQVSPPPLIILDDPTEIDDPETMPPGAFEPVDELDEDLGEFGDPLDDVEQAVREVAEGTGLSEQVEFRREARGLVVTILTDQVLFDEGQARIQETGYEILGVVADALKDVANDVMIEGHTDRRPISTAQFPSNWELSTARATSVLRHLVEYERFPANRISAAGYADTRPVDIGDTPDALAKNRRVEIVVLATATGG